MNVYWGINKYYSNWVCSPRLKIREPGFHKEFFRVPKILWIAYVWLARRKAQKTYLCFLSPPDFMNSLELQLLEEGNTLGCRLSSKIHAWTTHFLVEHVSFYRGAPTILFIKVHLSDGLLVGWRLHNWSWLLPQGAGAPHRIHFPLFTTFKRFLGHYEQDGAPRLDPTGNYCQAGWNKVIEKKLKCQP